MLLCAFLRRWATAIGKEAQYEDFTNGVISLPPIIYYISVTVIFLFLTVKVIEKRRWN